MPLRVLTFEFRHNTATALVMFPSVSFLGMLRWWVPWKFQAGLAAVARMLGRESLIEKYTSAEDWAKVHGHGKAE